MSAPQVPQTTSFAVAAARLVWMLLGPAVLFLLTFSIAAKGGGWLTTVDVVYFAVLALILGARWLEYRSGRGQTSTGEPLTAAGLRTYLIAALAIGLGVWFVANLIGNHWLAG
jgi:hypothetical protein